MRLVFGLVLILGMGLAGFAVYMARGYIGNYQTQLANERLARSQMVETVDVYVSAHSIRYGVRLKEEDVRVVRWPINAIPEGAFQSKEALFPQGTEILRTVIRAMEKDEAILAVKVTGPGEDAGVSSRLRKGMRAFAIKVDVNTGVSGFLRPGDRVDIYWTGQNISNTSSGRQGQLTKLILSKIKLLAIDQIADEDRNNPTIAGTVTVEVTPIEVAALAQAQASGRLTLSLVAAEDEEFVEAVKIDGRGLLGIEDQQVVEAKVEKICTVNTRRGGEIVSTVVTCPKEN
ncbi:MAG: Flp pilus assembly protein CpaB [Paracoccaceae bacterium]